MILRRDISPQETVFSNVTLGALPPVRLPERPATSEAFQSRLIGLLSFLGFLCPLFFVRRPVVARRVCWDKGLNGLACTHVFFVRCSQIRIPAGLFLDYFRILLPFVLTSLLQSKDREGGREAQPARLGQKTGRSADLPWGVRPLRGLQVYTRPDPPGLCEAPEPPLGASEMGGRDREVRRTVVGRPPREWLSKTATVCCTLR